MRLPRRRPASYALLASGALLALAACGPRKPPAAKNAEPSTTPGMQVAPPSPGPGEVVGAFRSLADAATLTDCATGLRYPVAAEAAFVELQQAYAKVAARPGAPVSARLSAATASRAESDAEQQRTTLIVTAVHDIGGDICATATLSEQLAVGPWQLQSLNSTPATPGIDGKLPSLTWHPNDGQLTGNAGCNRFFGGASIQGAEITTPGLASTKRFCAQEMAQETAFLGVVGGNPTLELKLNRAGEPTALTLRAEAGRAEFIRASAAK